MKVWYHNGTKLVLIEVNPNEEKKLILTQEGWKSPKDLNKAL